MTATPDINEILKGKPVKCGRGAPMGQASFHLAKSPLHLQLVRTPDGYSADGTYWGLAGRGKRRHYLYCAFNGADEEFAPANGTRIYVRASTRGEAKTEILRRYRNITFKR